MTISSLACSAVPTNSSNIDDLDSLCSNSEPSSEHIDHYVQNPIPQTTQASNSGGGFSLWSLLACSSGGDKDGESGSVIGNSGNLGAGEVCEQTSDCLSGLECSQLFEEQLPGGTSTSEMQYMYKELCDRTDYTYNYEVGGACVDESLTDQASCEAVGNKWYSDVCLIWFEDLCIEVGGEYQEEGTYEGACLITTCQ